MSKYIKPTFTLTSNASSATTDPGPLSVALSLSATPDDSGRLTVDELITAREKLMEYNYLSDEERQYYNDILDAADKTLDKLQNDPTFKIKRQDIADGGRAAFKDGGFDKGRRNFMKMAAGLASIPFIGKFFNKNILFDVISFHIY